ncbi:hypothetical protein GBAR_LOCUS18259 [Geodia barretti]|nr:hypothetical protein GBAR_LOCUS18259 [Geodia barretti]
MINDTNPVLGLYVLYPITEVTAAIEVEAGTLTFRVRCNSTGGRALNMAVSGPNGYNSDISTNIQPIGTPEFLSNDRYTARTEVISSGMVGDVFQCNVTNFASHFSSVTLRAAASTITGLMQTALTTVVVMWTPPPEAAVNGYTVRYRLASGNGGDGTMTVSQGSTSTPINDLTNGETYTFSIAAIASNMLPGVSEEMNITLASPDTPEGVLTAAESSAVTVSWGGVDDVDRYTVTFSMAQGTNQQGLCSTDSHTATLTVDVPSTTVSIAVGGDVGSTVTDS